MSHKDYTQAIINQVAELNPHYNQDGRIGYVYAAGYLASYLASLMQEDPYVYKRFVKHSQKVKAQNKARKQG
jgi:hypothetical protein